MTYKILDVLKNESDVRKYESEFGVEIIDFYNFQSRGRNERKKIKAWRVVIIEKFEYDIPFITGYLINLSITRTAKS